MSPAAYEHEEEDWDAWRLRHRPAVPVDSEPLARAAGERDGAAREREIIATWCETQARWFTVCRPPRPEAAAVYAEVAAQIRTLP